MTASSPSLNPQILGVAENAHRAILNRLLRGTGLTYLRWAVLSVTAASGDAADRDQVLGRVTAALKAEVDEVSETINWLKASGLLESEPGKEHRLRITEPGRTRFSEIRRSVDEIVARIYSGIPAEDLATAGRVLVLVTQRANYELAALQKDSRSPAREGGPS